MAKTFKVKSELKEEKRKAFWLTVLFAVASVLLFALSIYLFIVCKHIYFPIIVLIISLTLVLALFMKRREYMILRSGVKGENEALDVLKTLPDGFTVISNPVISNRGKYNELDFVVISEDAIFTIETKNYKGGLKGKTSFNELIQIKKGKDGKTFEKSVKNPIMQSELQNKRMRDLLFDLKIHAQVYSILYFADENFELSLENDSDYKCKIIKGKAWLLSYIQNTHSDKKIKSSDIKKIKENLKR